MTIAIGLLCNDGIVIAADSRTTEESGYSHDYAQKVDIIGLKGTGHRYMSPPGPRMFSIVAQSGNVALGARAIEIIKEDSKEAHFSDYRSMTDLAEKAVDKIKMQMRKQFHGTAKELQEHFEERSFELLIGYYFNSKQYLFTLDFALGVAQPKTTKKPYISIGSGSVLADFLLDGFDIAKMNMPVAHIAALYVIEQVKKFDPRCGGPTLAGTSYIYKDCVATNLYTEENTIKVSRQFAQLNQTMQSEWSKHMLRILREESEKVIGKWKDQHGKNLP